MLHVKPGDPRKIPQIRWADDLKRHTGTRWMNKAGIGKSGKDWGRSMSKDGPKKVK